MRIRNLLASAVVAVPLFVGTSLAADLELLNVSYDASRELYQDIDSAFTDYYKEKTGKTVAVTQSHGGSGKQARAVTDGLKADLLTPALSLDIDGVASSGLIDKQWQARLPYNSSPYTSTIIFLVRKGNPKAIKDWGDLIKPGVKLLAPNPKTGGGSRWIFLAAWGYGAGAQGRDLTDQTALDEATAAAKSATSFPLAESDKGKTFVAALYQNIAVLDTGARGSAVSFAQKNIGDVLITWENEAWQAQQEYGTDKFEIVYPSISILAEPPVTVVDKNVDDRKTREPAEAFLNFLYTPVAQEIIAENHYRPRDPKVAKAFADKIPPIKLFTIDEVFGGWEKAQKRYFVEGAIFDEIYKVQK